MEKNETNKKISVKNLISGEAKLDERKPISQKLIGRENLDDIDFLPIGTEVVGIRKAGPNSEIIKVKDYFISSVSFSMYESGPLYNLQRMTSDEDGLLNIYCQDNFSEATLVIKDKAKIKMSTFCPYRTSIVLSKDKDENKKLFEEKYKNINNINCSNILDDSEFILPGELIYIFAGEAKTINTVESIEIDKDYTISYRLKSNSKFYVTNELAYSKSLLLNNGDKITVAICQIRK